MPYHFHDPVPDNGYRWWYLDAISDAGDQAITVIMFVGSVFSPYYAWARQRGPACAEGFCAFNVALYGRPRRWCMTERASHSVSRSADRFQVGPSSAEVRGQKLHLRIDEWSVPLPRRMRGEITVDLPTSPSPSLSLDADGQHQWMLYAPQTPITVNFSAPNTQWKGSAYVDSNAGSLPLEASFQSWNWSRAHLADTSSLVQYDVVDVNGVTQRRSLRIAPDGSVSPQRGLDTEVSLPNARIWRMPRTTRVSADASVRNIQTLEDTPFYTRNRYDTDIEGIQAACIHESLDLTRFKQAWVRCLLPFRMPRFARGGHTQSPQANVSGNHQPPP